jgi:hypothetical protein
MDRFEWSRHGEGGVVLLANGAVGAQTTNYCTGLLVPYYIIMLLALGLDLS